MISIIIPIWNSESFLNECLTSVASQTEKDWECLLIDDGSYDNSLLICLRWCESDGRFKLFRQDHIGVSAARNRGIRESSGDYIVFVDSDDVVTPTYLEHLLEAAPAEIVVGGCARYYVDGQKEKTYHSPTSEVCFRIEQQNSKLFAELNENFLLYGPCAKLFNAEIIKNNQLVFPENCSLGEDLEFNYNYLRQIDTISCITACDYYYFIRGKGSSLSSIRRFDQFDTDIEQWRIIRTYCEDRGILGEDMKTLLAKRLWEIVYDSLFFKHPYKKCGFNYYKRILKTPEISFLANYKSTYYCSPWIKTLILCRSAAFFYFHERFSS